MGLTRIEGTTLAQHALFINFSGRLRYGTLLIQG